MKPVDPSIFSTDRMLKNLQGNTVKGHGRDFTTHIFIRFRANRTDSTKKWIRAFAEDCLTSCKKQLEERAAFKQSQKKGDLFANFFLTASGYDVLGFKDVASKFGDSAFKAGMKKRQIELDDPNESKWEKGFRERIDAMILLADDDDHRMGQAAKEIIGTIEHFCTITVIEYGNAIRNASGKGIEHFGYVDGTSQPLFLKDEIEEYNKLHGIDLGTPALFDPSADTDLILIPDPYMPETDSKPYLGSYFVFRKLEQNVRQFKEAEEKIGNAIFRNKRDGSKREIAGAYLVGRFEDGSPVVMSDEDSLPNSAEFNNFNYSNDPSGGRCPYLAHVRKVNPRGEDASKKMMARRGIPFGLRNVDTELDPSPMQMPEGGVGLLFMSYQASIVDQFEYVQKAFCNSPSFPAPGTGLDPIIGQATDPKFGRDYHFPANYGQASPTVAGSFAPFVHMKGGEYFFAPSIMFLKTIG